MRQVLLIVDTAISKTIGISPDLRRFDDVRAYLKAHKHAKEPLPTHKKEEHDHLIAVATKPSSSHEG